MLNLNIGEIHKHYVKDIALMYKLSNDLFEKQI